MSYQYNIQKIMSMLPHRYPFLLVDRVVAMEPGKSIEAYKCVSFNEPFFQGHFPGLPVMPGVLIMEALAQAGGIMVLEGLGAEKTHNKICLFTGIERARFRRSVTPGDRLDLSCTLVRNRLSLWKIAGVATVNGQVVAEGELTAALNDMEPA